MIEQTEILIVGGGPIGLACGLEAQKAGLNFRIIEKGCLVNSLYNYPANMSFFSTSEKLEIGGIPFVSNNPKPTRSEALEYYRRVGMHLNVQLFEEVLAIKKLTEGFAVATSKANYFAQNIVLATGFYDIPVLLNVPGENLSKVTHYYKEPHFYAGQRVIVVGANNSAVDAALETYRKGAKVTMVVRSETIGQRVKYWVKPDIENRIAEGSIDAFFSAEIADIQEDSVTIQTKTGSKTIPNDFVIAATGYRPNFAFLESLGLELSQDSRKVPLYNPQTQESSVEGVYLAGVVCGGMETHRWFIENSRVHAEAIVAAIITK